MLKMHTDSEASASPLTSRQLDEPSEDSSRTSTLNGKPRKGGFFSRLKSLVSPPEKTDEALREAIEEYIVEPQHANADSVSTHERVLLYNILNLRDNTVVDTMIPRADIAALDIDITKDELLKFSSEHQFSRFPVYKETLDDVLGTIHIKDIMAAIAEDKDIKLKDMITEIPIVSPAMPILDLVLQMRYSRRHMAMVVDEYGGIDGLITLADVIETIIGEIDDEHDNQDDPEMINKPDGSITADARVDLEEFERRVGKVLGEEEREESDTIGGLVFDLAGRVPARGEVITHPSGIVFEILEADPRKISRVKITNFPEPSAKNDGED